MRPVIESPKSVLNLACLKAAFSSQQSSSSGNKSGMAKSANSGPTQKTLQSFLKPSTFNASVKFPLKSTIDLTKCSPAGKSVLDGFRYGNILCSDTDNEKGNAASSCDFNTAAADGCCSALELSSHEPAINSPSVENETFKETSQNSPTIPEEFELQPEPCTSKGDEAVSPNAKRARKEDTSNTFLIISEGPFPSVVDTPVCLQKREVPLHFSLLELAERMKRLCHQQKETGDEKLCYRRFRAKINPGENQSAEDELKKEIR